MSTKSLTLDEFLELVDGTLRPGVLESFWECEEPLSRLIASQFLEGVINNGLQRLAARPDYLGDWLPNEIVLTRSRGAVLTVALAEARKRYLHVQPYHSMYAVLEDVHLSFTRYNVPDNFQNEIFSPGLRLTDPVAGVLRPGEILRVPCGQSAIDFDLSRPVIMLKFMTSAILPLEWLFARETLQAWQANDADISFTQLRVAADVLGKLAHQSSIVPLKLMTKHEHHSVRWAAIQNLARINRSEAVIKLKEAAEDPHPHVRNAAKKTLQKIGA